MTMRRPLTALAAACAFGAAAEAAPPRKAQQPPEEQSPRLNLDLRAPPGSASGDMLPLAPVGQSGAIGLGRFSVIEPARPRTNMEPERDPSDVSRRRRGIGGLGLRLVF